MSSKLRNLVQERAGNRCEYCHIHQDDEPFYRFHLEHIIARQHRGSGGPTNLALSCHHCNLHKGPNLSAIDPITEQVVLLFNPREQNWHEHFSLRGPSILGLTPIGRATIQLLQMNALARVELRSHSGQ